MPYVEDPRSHCSREFSTMTKAVVRRLYLTAATLVAALFLDYSSRYLAAAEILDPRYSRRRIPFVGTPLAPAAGSVWFGHRQLQRNETTDSCSLCRGYALREDVAPPYEPSEEIPEGLTCRDWAEITATFPLEFFQFSTCQIIIGAFAPACCETPPSYVCEQNVRSQIFANYDAAVAPLVEGKLQVGTQLDFYHITELDLKSATAQIFTWLHLNWTDPRLAWDSSNSTSSAVGTDTCAASITVRASLDAEITDIWVPDYDLYNQASGVQDMPEAMATVYPDGSVTWVRNGGIRALCFFSGLRAFPYDTLGCTFLFGGWTRQGNIEFILGGEDGDGLFVGDNVEDIKYTEYKLIPEKTETGYQDSDAVYYNFFFERSQRYYVTKIVIPTIIFTILSFGVFLLDPRVGERLTYGLTVLLVIIAQDIVTSERLPVADERLWINVFSNASFYWVLVSLLESIFIMWLYFLSDSKIEGGPRNSEEISNSSDGNDTEENHHDADNDEGTVSVPAVSTTTGQDQESLQRSRSNHRILPSKQGAAKTLKRALMSAGISGTPRHQFIKKVDRVCFIIVPSSYIIFVIVMLATKPQQWSEEHEGI